SPTFDPTQLASSNQVHHPVTKDVIGGIAIGALFGIGIGAFFGFGNGYSVSKGK
ncbi:unnamed protein product, partial [Rotaria sp. Silwood1]